MTGAVGAVLMRDYFSRHHLHAAEHFARLARHGFNPEHRAYVTGTVLSSAAFLEAAVNEVFDDVVDNATGCVDPLSLECRRLMAGLWNVAERRPILEKYQIALLCAGEPAFDKGQAPYQDAKLLIQLRDKLTHSRPKTRQTGNLDPLSQALQTRFQPNRLTRNFANPFFPDQCLSAGCAEWAVSIARSFADEFFKRVNIQANYQR